jgi:GntR family transcriptional regulator
VERPQKLPMILTIDANSRTPIYQQIAEGIKSLIARGALLEGTALPPVRQMAADLGVNLNTIATAYRELQTEGLIAVRHGLGAVVASQRSSSTTDKKELRKPLRTAITQMILAGLGRADILELVNEELGALAKGAK